MPEFEIIEFIALIFILVPIIFGRYILKKRKDLFPLLPGAIFIVISFTFTNLEAFFYPDLFNFIEHLSILLSAVSFFMGLIYRHFHESKEEIDMEG
ncbi:MAG: hypothetical protein ACTSXH_19500 [Promethearchaeota archaeon]